MKVFFAYLIPIFLITLMSSCEEDFVPITNENDQEIVVEGYIEAGEVTNPTIVFVSKSIPFFGTITPDIFSKIFINNAKVTVNDGTKTVELIPLCIGDLPPDLIEIAAEVLGLDPNQPLPDICVYVDLFDNLIRASGRRYDLKVEVNNKVLTAFTTIPNHVPLYDFEFRVPSGSAVLDSFAELRVKISDPKNESNFYRYLTASSLSGGGYVAPFSSVTDDAIFDGKEFEFPLSRAQRRGEGGTDANTFGLYRREDTISIKWMTMDKAHFDFWNTRDAAANSGGPFSAYVRITSNINGGLGIWGGYAVNVYDLIVPKK